MAIVVASAIGGPIYDQSFLKFPSLSDFLRRYCEAQSDRRRKMGRLPVSIEGTELKRRALRGNAEDPARLFRNGRRPPNHWAIYELLLQTSWLLHGVGQDSVAISPPGAASGLLNCHRETSESNPRTQLQLP